MAKLIIKCQYEILMMETAMALIDNGFNKIIPTKASRFMVFELNIKSSLRLLGNQRKQVVFY